MRTKFWLEKPEWKRPLGGPRCRWENHIKIDFEEIRLEGLDWIHWLSIGTGSGLLWTRWWTFMFHKRRGICWLAERLLAFEDRLHSVELCGIQEDRARTCPLDKPSWANCVQYIIIALLMAWFCCGRRNAWCCTSLVPDLTAYWTRWWASCRQ
jgi:hypothetical protein